MDTDSFVNYIKMYYFYQDITGNAEAKFDTNEYFESDDRSIRLKIGLINYELHRKKMTEFVALQAKLYAYKKLDIKEPEDKKCKGIKKMCAKESLCI